MNNNVTGTINNQGIATPDLVTSHLISLDNPLLFQIFFLTQDGNQSVKVLENDEIDFEKILQHLKTGETVFIKYKNQEIFKPCLNVNNEEEQKHWYFTHC
jgi:hypothetical protein